ncbi:MAG TPA: hypothetical protein VFV87_18245 [Pirellulaceae bacterium]|nr:hypothetical protein [Pirellulaceae bacterium]
MQSESVALQPAAEEACWDEMRRRWADGEPLLAEEAFSRWPQLMVEETTAVDVIRRVCTSSAVR